MSFQVLIATIGRPSLQRMLDSLSPQLQEQDCLTLVFDGYSKIPEFNLKNFKCEIKQYFEPIALGYWGHRIRNKYSSIIEKRDFVMHADDDDIYLPDVFSELRHQCISKNTLYIARMNNRKIRRIIPEGDFIRINHIGTPNGIIPYDLNMKTEWKHQYGGDGLFYETISKEANVIFLPTVIYLV
jgi:hypothetical protein